MSVPSASATAMLDPSMWVSEFGDLLFRFALARVRDAAVAEELVQETLLAGLEGLDRFDGRSSPATWLVGILRHKIADHFRRLVRQADESDLDDDWEERASMAPQYVWRVDPANAVERRQLRRAFEACLEHLPASLRAVFVLREMDDVSTEKICRDLGLTHSNVWVRLYRARSALRACLEQTWFADGRARPLGRPRRTRSRGKAPGEVAP